MSDAFQISVIVLAVLQFFLFIAIFIFLLKLIKTINFFSDKVDNIQLQVNKLSDKIDPVIENVNNVIDVVGSISEKVNENMSVLSSAVVKVKDAVDDVIEFEQKIKSRIEPPVMETITTFNAIVKGVTAFIDKLKSGKKYLPSREPEEEYDYYYNSGVEKINEVSDVAKNKINQRYEDINKELDEVRTRLNELSSK